MQPDLKGCGQKQKPHKLDKSKLTYGKPMAPSKTSTPAPSIATDISTDAASSIVLSFQPSKKLRTDSDMATVTSTAKAPAASISKKCCQHNLSNGNNDIKKRKRTGSMYVRDSSYWFQKTGKKKCPLNYEPDSDYWSYPSSSECSYNHKGEPGFEELKFSDSESE